MPLFPLQSDLDARSFALFYCTAQREDQGLNVRENNRRGGRAGKDGLKRFSLFGIHEAAC